MAGWVQVVSCPAAAGLRQTARQGCGWFVSWRLTSLTVRLPWLCGLVVGWMCTQPSNHPSMAPACSPSAQRGGESVPRRSGGWADWQAAFGFAQTHTLTGSLPVMCCMRGRLDGRPAACMPCCLCPGLLAPSARPRPRFPASRSAAAADGKPTGPFYAYSVGGPPEETRRAGGEKKGMGEDDRESDGIFTHQGRTDKLDTGTGPMTGCGAAAKPQEAPDRATVARQLTTARCVPCLCRWFCSWSSR
jgi:hypothetical protein